MVRKQLANRSRSSRSDATDAACSGEAAPAQTEHIAVELPASRTAVVGARSPEQSGAGTIRPDAKLLFVAGAGWTKKQSDGKIHTTEAGDLILQFLSASGASLGSSKSLVDQGAKGILCFPSSRTSIK
jgi:electron transfer flavoprotein alpha subunit